MSTSGSCSIRFAGATVTVDWRGARALSILRFLYPYAAETSRPHGAVNARFRLNAEEANGLLYLHREDELVYQGPSDEAVAGILLDHTVHALADDCRIGPLFHAAAVSYKGRGILLPAQTGSGKTTLSAWLASQGWNYLSDELVCIESGTLCMKAFYRPLYLRTASVAFLTRDINLGSELNDPANGVCRSERGVLIHATRLNPANTYDTPEAHLILFPQYRPDAVLQLTRLPKAHACMRLVGCLVNARNLPEHGLPELSRLARQIPAYTLTYSSLGHIAAEIEALVDPA